MALHRDEELNDHNVLYDNPLLALTADKPDLTDA
jgi:hypothetical protein